MIEDVAPAPIGLPLPSDTGSIMVEVHRLLDVEPAGCFVVGNSKRRAQMYFRKIDNNKA